jgi:hypothetical protein
MATSRPKVARIALERAFEPLLIGFIGGAFVVNALETLLIFAETGKEACEIARLEQKIPVQPRGGITVEEEIEIKPGLAYTIHEPADYSEDF